MKSIEMVSSYKENKKNLLKQVDSWLYPNEEKYVSQWRVLSIARKIHLIHFPSIYHSPYVVYHHLKQNRLC